MTDEREVLYDAKEHTDLVGSILAETHLKPHNIFRHIDVCGKRIIDVGCGDGAMSRESINRGADYVFGIDGKVEMIQIAKSLNHGLDGKIHYFTQFIEDVKGLENFDIAILSYLLNNARSVEQLSKQVRRISSFLKKGGVVVVYNSNPFDVHGGDFTKYGFRKTMTGTHEGAPIMYDYRPAITDDIINYYLNPEAHERAFRDAGFTEFRWEPLQLYPGADEDFWKGYFNREHLPVIGAVVRK